MKVQRDSYAQITDGHFDAFNSHRVQATKSGHTGGHEETGTSAKPHESSEVPVLPLPDKTRKNSKKTAFLVPTEYPRQESNNRRLGRVSGHFLKTVAIQVASLALILIHPRTFDVRLSRNWIVG